MPHGPFESMWNRASELIRQRPKWAWAVGVFLPSVVASFHCLVIRLTWQGLPQIFAQFTLLMTIASGFAGLSIALLAMRAIKTIPIQVRPFLLIGSCVVMVIGLFITRNLFYG